MANSSSTTTQEDILRFKLGLDSRREDGPRFNESPLLEQQDGEFSAGGSNRGNKCLYNTDTVSSSKMDSSRDSFRLVSMSTVDQDTGKPVSKLVLQNKKLSLDEVVKRQLDAEYGSVSDDEDDNYDDDVQNVLESIDLAEILGPITSPSDIVNRKSISTLYKSHHLGELADQTIDIIEREQANVNQLSRLMSVFLGDDPKQVYEKGLKLPDYDHHLDLTRAMTDGDGTNGTNGTSHSAGTNGHAVIDGDSDTTREDDTVTTATTAVEPHILTNEASNQMIDNPFFKLGRYQRDFNYGIHSTDEAGETRQMVQIALQRNEEFIRALRTIRTGFVKADRLKDNIYRWCKEIDDSRR